MIFTGDIAAPLPINSLELQDVFERHADIFNNKILICNFEGLLNDEASPSIEPLLYNSPEVLNVLNKRGVVVACLANNHTLDLTANFDETIIKFKTKGIYFTGAGKSVLEAEQPAIFSDDYGEVIVFNACWDFLLYNHRNPSDNVHIALLREEKLLKAVSQAHIENPKASIVACFHWSFDLETLPFPMHRQFAKRLIDEGCDLVVGTHSHCVQGGEEYKNGKIVYGLGNFLLPQGAFAEGKLKFPDFAKIELVLEWEKRTNKTICHWFEYQKKENQNHLEYLGSEDFSESERLKFYSPYQDMGDKEYLKFFRINRRKKFFVPVLYDYRKRTLNYFYTMVLKIRAHFARYLAKKNLRKWQS